MTLEEIFKDKTIKSKQKTETIAGWLLDGSVTPEELLFFAENAKEAIKATCIEALELSTREKPGLGVEAVFEFVVRSLAEKAPRVKWESARVIGNIAQRYPNRLEDAIRGLLGNTGHEGTVVRWSAAFALGQIILLKTPHNDQLVPTAEAIVQSEESNGIRKIYLSAIKKARK